VRQLEQFVQQAELAHHFERGRMNRVAAKVAQKIGVFFQYDHLDSGARVDSQRELTCAQKKEGSTGRVIYCTTIASPLLIAISRILAGRSNGASMSNPLG
jgi:hypothetical protein